jgi:hypothetical protein
MMVDRNNDTPQKRADWVGENRGKIFRGTVLGHQRDWYVGEYSNDGKGWDMIAVERLEGHPNVVGSIDLRDVYVVGNLADMEIE